jgi:hypothetical protein
MQTTATRKDDAAVLQSAGSAHESGSALSRGHRFYNRLQEERERNLLKHPRQTVPVAVTPDTGRRLPLDIVRHRQSAMHGTSVKLQIAPYNTP